MLSLLFLPETHRSSAIYACVQTCKQLRRMQYCAVILSSPGVFGSRLSCEQRLSVAEIEADNFVCLTRTQPSDLRLPTEHLRLIGYWVCKLTKILFQLYDLSELFQLYRKSYDRSPCSHHPDLTDVRIWGNTKIYKLELRAGSNQTEGKMMQRRSRR